MTTSAHSRASPRSCRPQRSATCARSPQWTTAGSGLLHIERPPESLVASGGLFHGVQLWVNLPAAQKVVTPRYQDLRGSESALLTTPDGGALVRVIAGDLAGRRGPGSTYTPMAMMHATISPGAILRLILGGAPIREPIAWGGPFVMNTREEVLQAFEDYRAGLLGAIPATPVPQAGVGGGAWLH